MHPIADALRTGLAGLADPVAAEAMQRYMKSAMPFRGVAKPARRKLLRVTVAAHPPLDAPSLRTAAAELWDGAGYREERYLALSLLDVPRHAALLDPTWVPLLREWIVTGAWWDFTDEIASRRIGPLLRADPADLTPTLKAWAADPDRWLRRTSVICQLGSGAATDVDLLTTAIEANATDTDFFLRKGIGWALRQHARTDAEWVRRFVAGHPELSPLTRREALKHLGE
ncbi:DNA alkylation repair protein [Pseudonocardia sp. CNS-139]|nr:DNA alkylation repair protein [Pseudonocardia sp. CNS-139]